MDEKRWRMDRMKNGQYQTTQKVKWKNKKIVKDNQKKKNDTKGNTALEHEDHFSSSLQQYRRNVNTEQNKLLRLAPTQQMETDGSELCDRTSSTLNETHGTFQKKLKC